MTDYEALILACLNDPDDEGLRLILADWLDEQGKPHILRYPGEWRLYFYGPLGQTKQCLAWELEGSTEYCHHRYVLGPLAESVRCGTNSTFVTPDGQRHARLCVGQPVRRCEGRWLCNACLDGHHARMLPRGGRKNGKTALQAELGRRLLTGGALTVNEFRALVQDHPDTTP